MSDTPGLFDFMAWLGAMVVLLVAMSRFNITKLLIGNTSLHGKGWHKVLEELPSWSPGSQSILCRLPGARMAAIAALCNSATSEHPVIATRQLRRNLHNDFALDTCPELFLSNIPGKNKPGSLSIAMAGD